MSTLHKSTGARFSLILLVAMAPAVANAAGLLIADGGFGGVLEIKEQDVHVTINNGIAVTEIDQVFVNTEQRIVEALYTFPVPKGASVSNFSMWINGKEMIGEVVEKKRARQIYESYKQTRRDPGLLEQVDYKTFEMRIFPIPAGGEQRVKLRYYQELDVDNDWATYVYPLATVTRTKIDQKTQGRFSVVLDVKSEVPIVELSSPSHKNDFVVAKHDDFYWRASLETAGTELDRDVVLAFHVERPQTGFDIITSRTAGEDGFFQLTLTAGKELEDVDSGMDYVFVLDTSGSMARDGKLSLSRQSLASFIKPLGPNDRFELMTFNVEPKTLFNEMREANEDNTKLAAEFLETQRAVGGTVLQSAIETAYRYQGNDRTLNVVILSDGMTEQNSQAELIRLIKQRPSGCRVFCIGVGNEVNRPLLSQIADEAGGLAAFISQGDDFERQAQAFRRKLTRPAISNLQLAFSNAEIYDVHPAELPNLYHGVPLRIYGRYSGSSPVNATIQGEVQGMPFNQSVEIDLPEVENKNPEIQRMWAWKRVDQLLASARKAGNTSSVINEVVSLCENFSIVSQYASFIVLENDGEYRRWKIDRRNAARIAGDRQAQALVQNKLSELRNQSLATLGPQGVAPQSSATQPSTSQQVVRSRPNPASDRGFNLSLPGNGGSGGGAFDPISAAIAASLAGAAAARTRRRKTSTQKVEK